MAPAIDKLTKVKDELREIAIFIESTRRGMESIGDTVRVGNEKFSEASGDIDTVTLSLEEAANRIMGILEKSVDDQEKAGAILEDLAQMAGGMPSAESSKWLKPVSELQAINTKTRTEIMEVFSNMSFHDLSGQKLRKVVSCLATVEIKIAEMAAGFGVSVEDAVSAGATQSTAGPKGSSVDQGVVDKMIKERGGKKPR